jgi:hypothetical protein
MTMPELCLQCLAGRSEQDCVMNFARFLNDVEVPWDAMHQPSGFGLALAVRATTPSGDGRAVQQVVRRSGALEERGLLGGGLPTTFGTPARLRIPVETVEKMREALPVGASWQGYHKPCHDTEPPKEKQPCRSERWS